MGGVQACSADTGHTIASYFEAFAPAPPWDDLPSWPPDVFALANLVLDHAESFRFVVAPPPGRRWPPSPGWRERVRAAARAWRDAVGDGGPLPEPLRQQWEVLTAHRAVPLSTLRDGEPWEVCEALLTLHALADEACAGLAAGTAPAPGSLESRAWEMLTARGSLSRLSPARVRITPKTHFASRGITIRSLSRYLALCYEAVAVRWRRADAVMTPGGGSIPPAHSIVLLPWPLTVRAEDFQPVRGPIEMDTEVYGFFRFSPPPGIDVNHVSSVLEAAHRERPTIDAVVLPEGAATPEEIAPLEEVLDRHGVRFFVARVRRDASDSTLGRNYVHVGVREAQGWECFEQDKHHRWCLDEGQIRQYHLTRVLDPSKLWWEAIDLPPRMTQIVDLGGGATTAPLVCEDLARMDEVADLLRRVGPSLVIAVLLDGPQLATRWPCRYASVLADEPGSAVLTLTSFGMAARSRPAGCRRSRVVALWSDRSGNLEQIPLGRGATGVLLELSVESETVWTADGRCHEGSSPNLLLRSVHQLRTR